METYSFLRGLADSWALLLLVLFFVGVILFVFRPGSRKAHRDAADAPPEDEHEGDVRRPQEQGGQPDEHRVGPRQLGAEHLGDQPGGQHAMGDPLAEDRGLRIVGIEVHRVGVASHGGEEHDIRLGDRLAEAGRETDREILETQAVGHGRS